jgi:septal ring factor EnvC (AmiA/AmiB activator)
MCRQRAESRRRRAGLWRRPAGFSRRVLLLAVIIVCWSATLGSDLLVDASRWPWPVLGAVRAAASTGDIEQRRQELARLKQQLENERRQARQLRGQEQQLLAELGSVDKQLSVMERYLAKLEEQEQALDARLAQLAREIDARQADLDASRDRLAARIRQMHTRGKPSLIEVVFASESLPDLFRQLDLMMRLADEEKRLMADIEGAKTELLGARQEVEQGRLEVQLIRAEKDTERGALVGLRSTRQAHLQRIASERRAREAAVAELAAAQQELEQLIQTLEARIRAEGEFVPLSGPFAEAAGRLPWPIRGTVIGSFGRQRNAEHFTSTINNGIDIRAPAGTSIRAVADGKVAFRDWLTGYGNCIILNHGGGYYTFYAHASAVLVDVGQVVASGHVIGRVGDTGSLKGAMLHFEVRRGSQALDPRRWLAP